MNETESAAVLRLAERFVAAIEARDVDTVRRCYAPQARIWHNVDGKVQSVDDNIKGVHWIHKVLSGVHYDVKRRLAIPGGFLQEHVLRGTDHPIIPIYMGGSWGTTYHYYHGRLVRRWFRFGRRRYKVVVVFGRRLPAGTNAFRVRQAVMELSCDYFNARTVDVDGGHSF